MTDLDGVQRIGHRDGSSPACGDRCKNLHRQRDQVTDREDRGFAALYISLAVWESRPSNIVGPLLVGYTAQDVARAQEVKKVIDAREP